MSTYREQDRIPTYEESVNDRTTSRPVEKPSSQFTSSLQQRREQERIRRVNEIVSDHIEPTFFDLFTDPVASLVVVLVPSDALPPNSPTLAPRNISCPTPGLNARVIHLSGDNDRTAFWQQTSVIRELDIAVCNHLRAYTQNASTHAPLSPSTAQILPTRPQRTSWFKRTFGTPGPDRDPTGTTGQWNLGWRKDDEAVENAGHDRPEEPSASAKLRGVTFRIESELGLLDSRTINCVWIEIKLGDNN